MPLLEARIKIQNDVEVLDLLSPDENLAHPVSDINEIFYFT